MKEKTQTILFFTFLTFFITILSLTVVSFYFISHEHAPPIIYFFVKYHVFFMLAIAITGLIFGSLTHLFLHKKIDKDKEESKKIISLLLDMLNTEDKKIIKHLIKNKGVSTQYELSKIENMTKLKVHRSLEKLEQKNIVKKEKLGKINKIYLNIKL